MMKKSAIFLKNGQRDRVEFFEESDCVSVKMISESENHMRLWYMCWQGIDFTAKDILVLGCGNGNLERLLLDSFKVNSITLMDASKTFIEIAQKRCVEAKVLCADLLTFDLDVFDKKYDIIYSFDVMQYVPVKHIIDVQNRLLKCLTDTGAIYHFGVPEKKRKWLFRIERWLTTGNFWQLFHTNDFVDKFSHWLMKKDFYSDGYSISFVSPSFRFERFDVQIKKNKYDAF